MNSDPSTPTSTPLSTGVYELVGVKLSEGNPFTDIAIAAFERSKAEAIAAEEERERNTALLAETAFVKRFGYAPDRTIAEERTIELDGQLFYYHMQNQRLTFAMLGTCHKCGRVDPEHVATLADIGQILAHGLRYHECPSPHGTPEGAEDKLLIALAAFVEQYAPTTSTPLSTGAKS